MKKQLLGIRGILLQVQIRILILRLLLQGNLVSLLILLGREFVKENMLPSVVLKKISLVGEMTFVRL